MIKGVLSGPMNHILGRIEGWRVGRRMQKFHRGVFQVLPAGLRDDFRQQRPQGDFHVVAMGTGVIQDHRDPVESLLDMAQNHQDQHPDDIGNFTFGTKIDAGSAALKIHRQKTIQALPAPFIAWHFGGGIFRRPSVVGVRGRLQGEFIQRYHCTISRTLGNFFLSLLRKRPVARVELGHNHDATSGGKGQIDEKVDRDGSVLTGFPTFAGPRLEFAWLSIGSCPDHNRRESYATECNARPDVAEKTMPAGHAAAQEPAAH